MKVFCNLYHFKSKFITFGFSVTDVSETRIWDCVNAIATCAIFQVKGQSLKN